MIRYIVNPADIVLQENYLSNPVAIALLVQDVKYIYVRDVQKKL